MIFSGEPRERGLNGNYIYFPTELLLYYLNPIHMDILSDQSDNLRGIDQKGCRM